MLHGWKATQELGALIPTSGIALVEFQAAKSLALSFHLSMVMGVVQPTLGTNEVPGSDLSPRTRRR